MFNDLWLVVSGLLILVGLAASQGLLLVVGSLVVVIRLATKVWDRYAFRGVTYSRALSSHRAFLGDTVEYTVTLTNDKVLPLVWLDIEDSFPQGLEIPGGSLRTINMDGITQHAVTTSLLPYQRVTWKYFLRCVSRGYHRIGPVRLRTGDIFGFTGKEARPEGTEELLVYPRIVDITQLMLSAERPLAEARARRPLYRDLSRFQGQRDYVDSDPMKLIDWKATARASRLQTRVFEPAISQNMLIALNGATSDRSWEGSNRRLFEQAVTLSASVANYAARQGYTFGLISNAVVAHSAKWTSVPLGASSSQLPMVLEALARVSPYVISTLPEVLRDARYSLPPGTTVALVTAVFTDSLAAAVMEMQELGHRVLIISVSAEVPDSGLRGATVLPLGKLVEALDEHEQVLAG